MTGWWVLVIISVDKQKLKKVCVWGREGGDIIQDKMGQ
jgi:hypothetical protein